MRCLFENAAGIMQRGHSAHSDEKTIRLELGKHASRAQSFRLLTDSVLKASLNTLRVGGGDIIHFLYFSIAQGRQKILT